MRARWSWSRDHRSGRPPVSPPASAAPVQLNPELLLPVLIKKKIDEQAKQKEIWIIIKMQQTPRISNFCCASKRVSRKSHKQTHAAAPDPPGAHIKPLFDLGMIVTAVTPQCVRSGVKGQVCVSTPLRAPNRAAVIMSVSKSGCWRSDKHSSTNLQSLLFRRSAEERWLKHTLF